jgi:predicted O-linked N-acetylglucosamine transferase (SPINDLY family)
MTTAADKVREAFGRFQAQDVAGAERLCVEILRDSPGYPDAMHLLGLVRLATGNASEAASLLREALKQNPRDATIAENWGVAHLALRDFEIAEGAFRQAFTLGASHGLLYMRLGIALASQGKLKDALSALRGAAARSPDIPAVHLNLGNLLAEENQLDDALASFNRLLELQPDNPLAHFNLGNLHRMAGRLEDAAVSYKRVLAVAPSDADTHNNLGLVYQQQQRLDQAAACYRQALALAPGHIHALSNLGSVLTAQGRLDEAAASFEKALAIRSDFVDALVNLGNVRAEQGHLKEAQALYERVLRLHPRNAEAHRNLGRLFMDQGCGDDAIGSYRKALELDGRQPDVHVELGTAHLNAGNVDAASACFRRALEIRPGHTEASYNLAETLKVQGNLEEGAGWYERMLAREPDDLRALSGLIHMQQHMCSWIGLEERWQRLLEGTSAANDGRVSPFSVLSLPSTPAQQFASAKAWARRNIEPMSASRPALGFDFSKRRARDRLRIGYLSWAFHRHATGHWAVELFELHDRTRCEAFAYAYGPDDGSEIRARIRAGADRFVDISRESHAAAARRIYEDGIDVLVDLTGYTFGHRPQIVALRPAPVQVNWFYPGTMGTACMDYFIADPFVVTAELEPFFTEKVARLPHCYMITDRKRPVGDVVPARPDCGLPEGAFVFCWFNQAYKILPDTFASWMRIMTAVPGSVLWLLESNRWATDNLRNEAAKNGVAPERVVFAPHQPQAEHLARYRLADLAIDSFPYTSHTTAADALWAGCPLVTRAGNTFASRVAGSALISAGLPELVTDSVEAFERLTVELATSPGRLEDIRRRLRETRDTCPLFDTPRFVSNLESAYEGMFKGFLDQKP